MLLFTVLIVPQVLRGAGSAPVTPQPTPGKTWYATVGAQSNDKGRQALAFLPNEIWIHAGDGTHPQGDSITWRFDAEDIHTVTFLKAEEVRNPFSVGCPGFSSPDATPPQVDATFDGTECKSSPPLVKGHAFTVNFPEPGNFKLVCLVHENMTGVVHVLDASQPLPHDQDFYDQQAADQRRDLLSDRDGRLVAAGQHHGECAAHNSLKARVVTAGIGEISATAGGSQTLSVVRFIDDKIQIRAGDTVEWTNQDPVTPHTVTFGTEPTGDPAPPSKNVSTDPDGALHAVINTLPADSAHSGFIMAALQDQIGNPQTALGVTRFRVTFPSPGVFRYICVLHDNLGMTGTVVVH
jgi:plastocyanin